MRTIHDAKDELTVREAATLLGRHASNIYRWIARGQLPYNYAGPDGRTLVVDKTALLQAEAANIRHGMSPQPRRETRDNVPD